MPNNKYVFHYFAITGVYTFILFRFKAIATTTSAKNKKTKNVEEGIGIENKGILRSFLFYCFLNILFNNDDATTQIIQISIKKRTSINISYMRKR